VPCLEFENKIGRRARVWLDDLPSHAQLSNGTTFETYVFDGGIATVLRSRVAIEILQPFGGSFHYGLLGGEYQWVEGNGLEVVVPIDTPSPERRYVDSLARSLDSVIIGGLPEYASAICAGIMQVSASARPCGILNLTCMAHGEIGSAPKVFNSLARAVIHALCRPGQPASLDEAMALLV
jgi:hypothetical protein